MPQLRPAAKDESTSIEKTTSSEIVQASFVQEELGQLDPGIELSAGELSGLATLEEIEQMAIAINPAIQKACAQLAALRGKQLQAGLRPNPRAGITGDDINENGEAGRYGVFYSQQVVRSNRLPLARAAVQAEIEKAEIQITELEQRLVTDVRQRYYDFLVVKRKSKLARRLLEISQNGYEATNQLVNAKEVAVTALLQAELELQKAQLNLKRTENEQLAADRRLAVLIDQSELPFDVDPGPLDDISSLDDLEINFQRLLDSSPELARLFANVEVARRKLAHERSLQLPDVNWQVGLAYDFAADDIVPNFQIGLPIQKFNWNQGAISEARHQIVVNQKAIETKALDLRQQLVQAYQIFQDAKLQVDAMRDQILPKGQEVLRLVLTGYEQGEVGFLQLLTAQRTYIQINLDYIQQLQILWQQKILIDGMLLDANLEQ